MLLGAGPLAVGVAKALGFGTKEALAVGASLAPCSTGVALVVLKRKRAVNTPSGQLVVATAFVEDIIALILLSELRALEHPSGIAFLRPVGVSLAFALAVGGAAVFVVPTAIGRLVLPLVPAHAIDGTLLLLLFAFAGMLVAALTAGGASGLMGAFLAGLSFCTIRSVEHVWRGQVKRLQTWLIRVFFGCSIGFDVPVKLYGSRIVWRNAAALWAATFGKLLAGACAVPRTAPNALTLGFAMASLGEFSFIVGKSAKSDLGLMSAETYASVTLAVLFTIVTSPTMLGFSLDWMQRRTEAAIADATKAANVPSFGGYVLYYKLNIKVTNRWGLLGDLNRCLAQDGVDVIEFRVDLKGKDAYYEAYLKDTTMLAPDSDGTAFPGLTTRLAMLKASLLAMLTHDPNAAAVDGDAEGGDCGASVQTVDFAKLRGLQLVRWLPGGGGAEWEEANLVGNEEQATLLMRQEAEAARRNVADIFALPRLAIPPTAKEEEECSPKATPRPTPSPEVRRPSLDAPLARTASAKGGLAAAMAAMAAHIAAQQLPTQSSHGAGSPGAAVGDIAAADDVAGGAMQSSASAPPAVYETGNDVDRAIAAAKARNSVVLTRRAEEEDTHGLLGLVRRHKPRGLDDTSTQLPPGVAEDLAFAATFAAADDIAAALETEEARLAQPGALRGDGLLDISVGTDRADVLPAVREKMRSSDAGRRAV